MTLKVLIGDNENENYTNEIEIELSYGDYATIKDGCRNCSVDEYDDAYERLCCKIEAQNDLPYDWYIKDMN